MKKSHFKSVIVFAIVLLTIIIFLQSAFLGSTVHADDDSTGGLVPCNNKCTLCHILVGLQNIFKYLMGLLFVATMFFVTLNGALMMVSAGSQKLLGQVKTALNYCLKGFLLFLICWVIVTGIMRTLGYKQLANWWEFDCDTTQVEPPPAPPTPPTPTPTERKCKDIGGICRIWNTSMEGQTKCEEGEQPQGQYKCENSGEVCCTKIGEKGICGGIKMVGNAKGCDKASPELVSLLECIKSKLGSNVNISSLWRPQSGNSSHAGGRYCKGTTSGADLTGDMDAAAAAAIACGADTVIYKAKAYAGGKIYTNASDHYDHVHVSVNNKKCGADYLK